MTTTAIEPSANGAPGAVARTADYIGQATAVEQARAVAEVQAAIVVAQQCPRNVNQAIAQLEESCRQQALADRAFFRYSRGGSAITGASIHLAREAGRCWGNIQYGITELRRDDLKGESEMQAWAWDVQTNSRASTTFIVKHLRDKRGGAERLTDVRDIYENNANMGARRLREQIFAIVPTWFAELAKDTCNQTLRDGGGKPLPVRISEAIKHFQSIGVSADQLERKQGRESAKWTEHDVAALGVTFKSIRNGEISIEDEFPDQKVSLDEINQQANKPPAKKAAGAKATKANETDPCPVCSADTANGEPHDDAAHEAAGV